MRRPYDPGRAMRERLQQMERRERLRDEAETVREGVAETVGLESGRGAVFTEEPQDGPRRGPYRRQSGLDWLAAKGRLTGDQKAAGERYGVCFRRAVETPSIASTLEVQPGGSGGGAPLPLLLARAEARRQAQQKLAMYRGRLWGQGDLVTACDRVCGDELTPREAAGGEREAGRLEAVLKVALDILASA